MLERVLFAGSGGQGILLIGKLLANVALKRVPHITYFPAYGAEVRGGTSNCQVILSSEEISAPVAESFETMILMNQFSLERFADQLEPGGLMIVERDMCDAPRGDNVIAVSATSEADRLGDTRVANVVMLGAYVAARKTVPPEDVAAAIEQILAGKSPALVELNLKALRLGMRAGHAG
jgi:2-oxoglutarate ferredoxin oxidoreductase subunit gamma